MITLCLKKNLYFETFLFFFSSINNQTLKSYNRNTRLMSWDAYYPLNDIEAWMNDMAKSYPAVASEVVGGTSFEGRQIKGLKISYGSNKKVIFIEAGIHSREWITMSTACYIINELLTSNENATVSAARAFDWYIFPVTNPDGYVWTHESVSVPILVFKNLAHTYIKFLGFSGYCINIGNENFRTKRHFRLFCIVLIPVYYNDGMGRGGG